MPAAPDVPPDPVRLRDAVPADLPAIVEIYNSTVASRMVTADTVPVSVESRRAWYEAHSPGSRPIWVAEDPGTGSVCAWISFSSFYGRPAYAATVEVSIYVAASHRRRGLGRHLLQQALERAPSLGVHTLLGYIFGHNEPSLRLFEAFGFARWAHLPRIATLDGIDRDLIIVGKRLAP